MVIFDNVTKSRSILAMHRTEKLQTKRRPQFYTNQIALIRKKTDLAAGFSDQTTSCSPASQKKARKPTENTWRLDLSAPPINSFV